MHHTSSSKAVFRALTLLFCLTLPACAGNTLHPTAKPAAASIRPDDVDDAAVDNYDPLETINRGVFHFNEVVDGVLLKPLAHIYLGVVPEFAQKSVKNILVNLTQPVVFFDSVLQWDLPNAGYTVSRFVVNSTVGVAGIFDTATYLGIPRNHLKDFGQTLGVYGVGSGPYLVLPLFGPSDLRDGVGLGIDVAADPFSYIFTTNEDIIYGVTRTIVTRADYLSFTDRVTRDSFDPYSTFRSIYQQHRLKVIDDYKSQDAAPEKLTEEKHTGK